MADDESTIENRVYLFKDLAAAYLSANPGALHGESRETALAALADLAMVSCAVADNEELEGPALAALIRKG